MIHTQLLNQSADNWIIQQYRFKICDNFMARNQFFSL